MGNSIAPRMQLEEHRNMGNDNVPQILESEDEIGFTDEQLCTFIEMFEKDRVLLDFLLFDKCCILADKYLLAMCFVYFARARLELMEYDRLHFFAALYLSHIMEEDDKSLRLSLIPWANAPNDEFECKHILKVMNKMWEAMNFRSLVSKFSCFQVISAQPDAHIWRRNRPDHHGNAYRTFRKCKKCMLEPFNDIFDEYEFDDDVYYGRPKSLTQTDVEADKKSSFSEHNTSYDRSCDEDSFSDEHKFINGDQRKMLAEHINDDSDTEFSDFDNFSDEYTEKEETIPKDDSLFFFITNKRKCFSYDEGISDKASRKIVKLG